MNRHHQSILEYISKAENLTKEEKESLLKAVKEADKTDSMLQFKLERLDKDKHTLSVMLEETIEDLQKKSKAIEIQNRELEIESALEKVRSRSLAMHKSEEMQGVVEEVFVRLKELGVGLDTANILIFQKNSELIESWTASTNLSDYRTRFLIPISSAPHILNLKEAINDQKDLIVHHYDFEEKNKWFSYLFTETDYKYIPEERKEFILNSPLFTVSVGISGNIGIQLNSYSRDAFNEDENNILKRFTKVFEQCHTRFLDLQKAEAQARESQIEAALERVRSKTMAMHKSEEVTGIAVSLNEELIKLGFEGGSTIIIIDKETGDTEQWTGFSENKTLQSCYVPYFKHPFHEALLDTWKKGEKFFVYTLKGEEKKTLDEHYFTTGYKSLPESDKKWMRGMESVTFSHSFMKYGAIHWGPNHLTEEQLKILQRFAKVFEQSYTRFLDLQKAEAQARESQIELGLERVRARAMAMQKSDELRELIGTVFTELTKLDLVLTRCVIMIFDPKTNGSTWWMANSEDASNPMGLAVNYHEQPPYLAYIDAWQERKIKWQYVLEGKTKSEWDNYIFSETELSHLPDFVIAGMRAPHRVFLNVSFNNFGNLTLASLEPLSDEHFNILLRFAKVFDLTYTRFNDLQKAEAQAREAQIELGLERVRARAMAMQKSDELKELVSTVAIELGKLDIVLDRCFIVIYDVNTLGATWWMSNPETPSKPLGLFVKYHEYPAYLAHLKAWQERKMKWQYILEGDNKKNWDKFLFVETELSMLPDFVIAEMRGNEKVYLSSSFNNFGYLSLATLHPLSEEQFDILLRFAKVFDLTYTRFNDLQKAEVQAKEAQIELGLERVRARAMAMQRSDELSELVDTVFKELTKLDFALTWCIINIIDESTMSNTVWAANPDINKAPECYHMLFEDYPFHHAMMKGWKERNAKCVYVLGGEEKKKYDEYLFNETEFRRVPAEAQAASRAMEKYVVTFTFSNFGGLQTVGDAPLSDVNLDILSRFGKVFDLTYTRFNDLKQAEAQARESQIQLALERVRARTMAMQHSDELKDAAALLFQQAKALGVPAYSCGYNIWEKDETTFTSWMSTQDGSDFNAVQNIPLTEDANFIRFAESRQKGEQFFVLELRGERMQDHYAYLKTIPAFKAYFDYAISVGYDLPETQIHHLANFSQGNLLFITLEPCPEFHDVFKRFAAVFEQTYTRFLDLQKAEAQAREAQIQLAMERVRARTMAMQRSEELADVATVLFQQVKALGVSQWVCGFNIWEIGDKEFTWYPGSPDGEILSSCKVPLTEHPVFISFDESRRRGDELFVYEKEGEFQADHYRYMMSVPGMRELLQNMLDAGLSFPTFQIDHLANFSHGNMVFITYEPVPEMHDVFRRFAKVFEQTYTRFLDLQKAEAQAKEARIEIALERIRARALAMHKSDELMEVAKVLREQMALLGQPELEASVVHLYEEDPDHILSWRAFRMGTDSNSEITYGHMSIPKNSCEFVREWLAKFYSDLNEYTIELSGAKQQEWYEVFFKFAPDVINSMREKNSLHEKRYYSFSKFSGGALLMVSMQQPSEEAAYLQRRAAVVFDLAYRRFTDLQKAEAQAKEAQIEAALEKVRSRSLAMHKSDELQEVVNTVFERLQELNLEMDSANIAIFKEGKRDLDYWIASPFQKRSASFHMAYIDLSLTRDITAARESGTDFSCKSYSFEEKNEWFEYAFKQTDFKFLSEQRKQFILSAPAITVAIAFSKHTGVQVNRYSNKLLTEEEAEILKRFSKVFEQAYIRFLDLEKAEAQARGAQIEASLERVRSKTMAMHNSRDVGETVATMFDELVKLGVETSRCGVGIMQDDYQMELWTAKSEENGGVKLIIGRMDMKIHPLLTGAYESWLKKERHYSYELKDEDLVAYYTAINNLPDYPIHYDINSLPSRVFQNTFGFNEGILFAFTLSQLTAEASQIFKRFAGLFGQTYRRYLDLQKAEANARESQIEASLERVRSKAMAMHKSEDLHAAVATVFEELEKLDLGVLRCGISILDKEKRAGDIWVTSITDQGSAVQVSGDESFDIHPLMQGAFEAWLRKEDFSYLLEGDDLVQYYKAVKAANFQLPESQLLTSENKKQYCYTTTYGAGGLFAFRETEFPEEAKSVMRRFASVFDLTYKRFLDLQKAEANAREAQIEAGLERVRARTMAMHSSEDVSIATATMFTELEKLGIENFRGGILNIRVDKTMDVWSVNKSAGSDPGDPVGRGNTIRAAGMWDMMLHPWWQQLYKGWIDKEEFLYYFLAGKDKDDYVKHLDSRRDYLPQGMPLLPDCHIQAYYFGEGAVWTFSLQLHSEEYKQVMKRFASVFSLTFRRYQDLKKAEAQAREATIEAALERVRGKAMAMHSSRDLAETIGVFYHELSGLSLTPRRCGVGLIDKELKIAEISTMNSTSDGHGIELIGKLDMTGHPVLMGVYNNWLTQTEYHPILRGNEIKEYYQLVRPQIDFPDYPNDTIQYGYFFFFEEGGVYAWTEKELNEDELKIYRRFTSVLSLTYKRYKDLKDAEARTQTAIKDAALDRIRADIASMRTINDLDRITPLIWNELTVLGIPFIRCGVFIMDDSQQLIHTFLSTPDGKAIAAFHLPYSAPGNLRDVVNHWREKENYISHWTQVDFVGIADTLVEQGAIASKEQYLGSLPKDGFYLHFLPFLQGMLYVGNVEQLKEEEIELIQHVADAFSTAYARYEDFNRLEAAKQQVEKTLSDLKQAQTQLVQSEKMASLGELTAGIAHEIQNPLNFVNNFSDVSNELLDEMMEEIAKGNLQSAKEIIEDVKQNLEKINHHGKRADGIVKGMLQHSRSSSGQKEMTDINILADEYLRLAFHGLRAKDKSFNAKFETHFDDSIGKVNVIPQEIGRVILNLINNAFYTVSEKKKINSNGYEPTVIITTVENNGKVEIKVKDNGNGIPQKVLDKIFQPFFTTKPTGQGTGLGLSLAYDIITKGHGGELRVETKEGEGSEFIVQLPASKTSGS